MIVQCPNCGKPVSVNGLGRKPLNIGVKNICDTLQDCKSIALAAEKLGCSRAYIYKVLKCEGLSTWQVVETKTKKLGR
jgi:hypothetical protein